MLSINSIADKFVFYNLKNIDYGYLHLTDSKGREYFFGDRNSALKANVKINSSKFSLKLLTKGSSGLGESYINL